MAAPAKKAGGIALLLGMPKKAAEEEGEDAGPMKKSAGEYSEELSEAFPDSGEWTKERIAAFKRAVMACME